MSEIGNISPDAGLPEGEGSRFARAHHILLFFVLLVLVIWILSGFYQVKADQVAIVERLGQFVGNSDGKAIEIEHGLHYHLPWPIDRVHIVSTQQQFSMPVKLFSTSPAEYAEFKRDYLRRGWPQNVLDAIYDPYLITGDKCVVHLDVTVQFHIDDPEAWLTSVSHDYQFTYDPKAADDMRNQLFQHIAQRALVIRVGEASLVDVLKDKREQLQIDLLNKLQEAMKITNAGDTTGKTVIGLGAMITKVEIGDDKVPDRVGPAYDNLNNQRAMAQGVRNSALADATGVKVKADAEKTTLIVNAQSYAQATIQAATGDASRFKQILDQYTNSPTVTEWTVYAEAVSSVSGNAKRIIFGQPGEKVIYSVDQPQYDAGQVAPK